MSEHPSFDRAKGFVALPVEVLELELTPGAFRLLVELCRMANLDGYCWPSLAQLSDRLGRSRSAISGYIKDLRAEGLIETEEQKTANGYNYRLKYRVTFWQKWRADMTAPARPKAERSVRQSERLKDKNQSHINHCQKDLDSEGSGLVSGWAKCFKGAAYPSLAFFPDPELVSDTESFLARKPANDQIISADIILELREIWTNLGLEFSESGLVPLAKFLEMQEYGSSERPKIYEAIKRNWPAHWRRVPDQKQFEKLVRQSNVPSPNVERAVLRGYLKRWELAQKHLPRPSLSDFVPRNDASAPLAAAR